MSSCVTIKPGENINAHVAAHDTQISETLFYPSGCLINGYFHVYHSN